jgi:hypothetical protein
MFVDGNSSDGDFDGFYQVVTDVVNPPGVSAPGVIYTAAYESEIRGVFFR